MKQSDKQINKNKTQQNNGDDSQHTPIVSQNRRQFRPSLLLTIAALLLALLTARLAWWQFDRAEQKAALENHAKRALSAAAINFEKQKTLSPYQRVIVTGDYLPEHQIFIDNRAHNKIAGVHVITPLRMADGAVIAVNRGWMAKHFTAIPSIPTPIGKVAVSGVLQKDQADAFTLSSQTEDGNVWQNLDLNKYANLTNLPLLTLVLYAENNADDTTLIPISARVDFKSAQSVSYAWQWSIFCLLTLVFYIILGYKPITPADPANKTTRDINQNDKTSIQ